MHFGVFCLVCTNPLAGGHLLLEASFASWFCENGSVAGRSGTLYQCRKCAVLKCQSQQPPVRCLLHFLLSPQGGSCGHLSQDLLEKWFLKRSAPGGI